MGVLNLREVVTDVKQGTQVRFDEESQLSLVDILFAGGLAQLSEMSQLKCGAGFDVVDAFGVCFPGSKRCGQDK